MSRLVFKTEDPVRHWITMLSGHKGFTKREIDVLTLLATEQAMLLQKVLPEYISPILFSTESRKKYGELLDINVANLNVILSSLRDKKVFILTDKGEIVDDLYIPRQRFEIVYDIRRKDLQGTSEEV